jgi:hypothetical protein
MVIVTVELILLIRLAIAWFLICISFVAPRLGELSPVWVRPNSLFIHLSNKKSIILITGTAEFSNCRFNNKVRNDTYYMAEIKSILLLQQKNLCDWRDNMLQESYPAARKNWDKKNWTFECGAIVTTMLLQESHPAGTKRTELVSVVQFPWQCCCRSRILLGQKKLNFWAWCKFCDNVVAGVASCCEKSWDKRTELLSVVLFTWQCCCRSRILLRERLDRNCTL